MKTFREFLSANKCGSVTKKVVLGAATFENIVKDDRFFIEFVKETASEMGADYFIVTPNYRELRKAFPKLGRHITEQYVEDNEGATIFYVTKDKGFAADENHIPYPNSNVNSRQNKLLTEAISRGSYTLYSKCCLSPSMEYFNSHRKHKKRPHTVVTTEDFKPNPFKKGEVVTNGTETGKILYCGKNYIIFEDKANRKRVRDWVSKISRVTTIKKPNG